MKFRGDPIAETTILRFGEGVDTVHCIAISCTVCTGLHLWPMKFLVQVRVIKPEC